MTKEMQTLALVPQGSLEAYIRAANAYPMLTAEEERELAERLHYQGDLGAAKQLILSHLRFVAHVARNYSGYGLPQADLIQEGNIGLMKAVRRFNPEVGVRLVSFAVHWIKAEIHEYVLRNWRIVKVATTKAQRKLFFNLRKTKQRLGWFNQDEVELVAKELGVTSKDVREMESRMSAQDMTFDPSPDDEARDGQFMAPVLYLQDKTSDLLMASKRITGTATQQINCLMRWKGWTSGANILFAPVGWTMRTSPPYKNWPISTVCLLNVYVSLKRTR